MSRALGLVTSLAAYAASQSCNSFSFDAREPVHTTAPYFASWNIDSSPDRNFFLLDWRTPALTAAATALSASGGARVRFGGTGNNKLFYDVGDAPACVPTPTKTCLNDTTWSGVAALAAAARSPLIFGVNFFPNGPATQKNKTFDPTNAVVFFQYAKARGDAIWGVELANELGPDGILTAAEQAAGLLALDDALAGVYGAGAPRPLLIGPDALGFHTPAPAAAAAAGGGLRFVPSADILTYMADYIVAAKGRLFAVNHHCYIEINATNVLDPLFLDLTGAIARQVVAAVRNVSATVEIHAGEIGPHNGDGGPGDGRPGNCAGNLVCGRWGSSLWYADSMGAMARAGYAAFMRQDFVGADYGLVNFTAPFLPSTDFWTLILWQRLVGTRVLAVLAPPPDARVRAYAHCGTTNGTVSLVFINLAPAPACVAAPTLADPMHPRSEWALTPLDGTVTSARAALGGAPLALTAAGLLPPMPGATVAPTLPIQLPPLGIVFVNFDTKADACGGIGA